MPLPKYRSTAAGRLYWPLLDPDISSISIMPDEHTPATETLIPYSAEHEVAKASITTPELARISVSVNSLDNWEDLWKDTHREHEGQDQPAQRDYRVITDGSRRDFFDMMDRPVRLVKCCGEVRPGAGATLEVVAADGKRVTIAEYVAAVHPWLMGLKAEIIRSMSGYDDVRPRDVLMVNLNSPSGLSIDKRKTWKGGLEAQLAMKRYYAQQAAGR